MTIKSTGLTKKRTETAFLILYLFSALLGNTTHALGFVAFVIYNVISSEFVKKGGKVKIGFYAMFAVLLLLFCVLSYYWADKNRIDVITTFAIILGMTEIVFLSIWIRDDSDP